MPYQIDKRNERGNAMMNFAYGVYTLNLSLGRVWTNPFIPISNRVTKSHPNVSSDTKLLFTIQYNSLFYYFFLPTVSYSFSLELRAMHLLSPPHLLHPWVLLHHSSFCLTPFVQHEWGRQKLWQGGTRSCNKAARASWLRVSSSPSPLMALVASILPPPPRPCPWHRQLEFMPTH
jgi:hypothetical protein